MVDGEAEEEELEPVSLHPMAGMGDLAPVGAEQHRMSAPWGVLEVLEAAAAEAMEEDFLEREDYSEELEEALTMVLNPEEAEEEEPVLEEIFSLRAMLFQGPQV